MLFTLPRAARAAYLEDLFERSRSDPGPLRVAEASVAWIARAHDRANAGNGGVPRAWSLIHGWEAEYPETTGYIVPTLLDYARARNDTALAERAFRMLDWLVSIELAGGGFQGGTVLDRPVIPVAFNTGQILLGLAAGARERDTYRPALVRTGDWLVRAMDPDGAFRRYPSPFASRRTPVPPPHAHDAHVAWALFEADRVEPGRSYSEAARKCLEFTLGLQGDWGWLDRACLGDAARPLTHTLGYALRGLVEGYRFTGDPRLLEASRRTADALLYVLDPRDGFLPGRVEANPSAPGKALRAAASWACLTGSAQIAIAWLLLFDATGRTVYRDAALAANQYVRRTIATSGPDETRGGVRGSYPIDGDYNAYRYLSWAAKFAIDACVLELAHA
jgi:hypothetical protein